MQLNKLLIRTLVGEIKGSCNISIEQDRESCRYLVANIDMLKASGAELTPDQRSLYKLAKNYGKVLNVLARYDELTQE